MKNIFIQETASIHKVLEQLQKTGEKCLLVVKKNKVLLGTITDGDIRRAILKKRSTKDSIKEIYNRKSLYLVKTNSYLNEAKNILKQKNIPLIPIINKNKKLLITYLIKKEIKLQITK